MYSHSLIHIFKLYVTCTLQLPQTALKRVSRLCPCNSCGSDYVTCITVKREFFAKAYFCYLEPAELVSML